MPLPLTEEKEQQLQNWFKYHEPIPEQLPGFAVIREAALDFARIVCAYTPSSADQTAAIRKIREAVMTANAAIACGGK